MRTFTAIEFDKEIKNHLWEQLQAVKNHVVKGNFTNQENFHLTLNFLGEVTTNQITLVKESINSAAIGRQPFKLKLDRLGQFNRGNKSILWIGIKKSPELEAVFNRLKEELLSNGFLLESRGLNPHITLCREAVIKCSFEQLSREIVIQPIEISVDKVSLMESTRIEGRLKYIPIYTKNF
jgi:RNA 2',3'-cyclic 3'-phosphodiesterase